MERPLNEPEDSPSEDTEHRSQADTEAWYRGIRRSLHAAMTSTSDGGTTTAGRSTSTGPAVAPSPDSSTGPPREFVTLDVMSEYVKTVEKLIKTVHKSDEKTKVLDRSISAIEARLHQSEERLAGADRRSVEIVGIFSSIVALVLAFVNTATNVDRPGDSYVILVAAAAGLVLFATLVEAFFSNRVRKWSFYVLPTLLPILALWAIGRYLFAH